MAQLDPLLGALLDKNAQELVMSEGHPAALRFDGKLRPVSQRALDRTQISRLLAELSDRLDADALAAGTAARFRYRLGDGRWFECQVQEASGNLTARVVPSAEPVAARAPQSTVPPSFEIDEEAASAPPRRAAPVAEMNSASSFETEDLSEAPAVPPIQVRRAAAAPEPSPVPVRAARPAPAAAVPVAPAAVPLAVAAAPVPLAVAPAAVPIAVAPAAAPVTVTPAAATRPAAPATVATVVPSIEAGTRLPRPERGSPEPIERLLRIMAEQGASDLHVSSREIPMLRLHGEMVRLEEPPTSAEEMIALLDPIVPDHNFYEFLESNDTDFAYEITGLARFRVNVFTDRKGRGAVFRMIPSEILTAEQLGLPEAVLGLCNLSKGLVLVTGPTGSGKSTTLAAMIDYINRGRSEHIITIEDPVEFVHENRSCLINQREIVTHTQGFKRALRAALREDPDIVLVGEMRDLETIAIAIETAETGHLVFGTLHTTTAISTVDRIIDQFPADRQAQIRTMLSESLKGVVAQTLLKKVGGGRVAALEVLIVTPAISNLIREGKTFQIPSMMQTGKKQGMRLLNDALIELVKNKTVEVDEAYRKAIDKASFTSMLKSAGLQATPAPDA